jgi:arginase
VAFGYRDEEEQRKYGSQPLPPLIFELNLAEIRRLGAKVATQRAIRQLSRHELEGFWLHLDADVLSDSIMPAVDYRLPDGLSWEEFATMLQVTLSSRRIIGIEITIYNPLLDPGRRIAAEFVAAISHGFKTASIEGEKYSSHEPS